METTTQALSEMQKCLQSFSLRDGGNGGDSQVCDPQRPVVERVVGDMGPIIGIQTQGWILADVAIVVYYLSVPTLVIAHTVLEHSPATVVVGEVHPILTIDLDGNGQSTSPRPASSSTTSVFQRPSSIQAYFTRSFVESKYAI